ncbi:serine--tRNA ligase [Candidatus Woesearchaeota archaeon]|nr:serine--tRNA ligase [Candidatus Woesearchaeota archaeon]
MLDINFIRVNSDVVKKDLKKRNDLEKLPWIDDLLKQDKESLELKQRVEELRHRRNKISEEINEKQKKKQDISHLINEAKDLPEKIEKLEAKKAEIDEKIRFYLLRIPNVLHESVIIGKDETGNKEIRKHGHIPEFKFKVRDHQELMLMNDLLDVERATKTAGARFYYLKNEAVILDLALVRFALDHLRNKGFIAIETPNMLKEEILEGAGYLPKGKDDLYYLKNENLCLVGTSEQAIAGYHKNETIPEDKLPLKYAGFSPCYRTEAGSHGKDTKGIFRTHQFNKVEQFIFCSPEESWKIFEDLQRNSEELFEKLEIPYHVITICTGDIGGTAAKKYDIEAWMPGQNEGKGAYREVTSCSNCLSYQAVRLNIRVERKDGKREYLHTLNNTAIATSRAMVALIENNQREDGSIAIPKALQPYTGFKEITPKKNI